MSPNLFTLNASPALTLAVGNGSSMNLKLFNSQSGSGVNNTFDSPLLRESFRVRNQNKPQKTEQKTTVF